MRREDGNGHRTTGRWVYPPDYPHDTHRTWRAFIRLQSGATEGASAASGPAAAAGAGAGGGGAKPDALTLTQAELDDIIGKRLARERAIWERKGGSPSQDERDELERLRQEEQSRKQQEAEKKGEWDRLRKSMEEKHQQDLTARDQRLDRATNELKTERIRRALVSAAARQNAIDPEEVADLLERRCRLTDEYLVEVLDDQGQRAYRGGDPLTPEQLVESYLGKKPHLVKAGSTGQGGGSRGGASVTGEGPQAPPELAAARQRLDELDKEAKRTGSADANAAAWAQERLVREIEAKASGKR